MIQTTIDPNRKDRTMNHDPQDTALNVLYPAPFTGLDMETGIDLVNQAFAISAEDIPNEQDLWEALDQITTNRRHHA